MEEPIKNLNHYTDEATKQMLQKVVERKRKYDKLYFQHLIVMWLTIGFTAIFLYYLYKNIASVYSYSFAQMFSVFIQNSFHLYAMMVIFALFGFMNVLREKRDKAEKEFHALRCEIIDKSTDLWRDEGWKERHKVFEMMKKLYDINLYHENK